MNTQIIRAQRRLSAWLGMSRQSFAAGTSTTATDMFHCQEIVKNKDTQQTASRATADLPRSYLCALSRSLGRLGFILNSGGYPTASPCISNCGTVTTKINATLAPARSRPSVHLRQYRPLGKVLRNRHRRHLSNSISQMNTTTSHTL